MIRDWGAFVFMAKIAIILFWRKNRFVRISLDAGDKGNVFCHIAIAQTDFAQPIQDSMFVFDRTFMIEKIKFAPPRNPS